MAKNHTDTADPQTTEEVVMRDESDEIIDELKTQLAGLKGQLAAYHSAEPGGPGAREQQELLQAWNAGLAPHLATRLQVPARELTGRLERLIEQADDPALRQELERCRDIAYYLFDTFRKISSSHQLLTDSLTAPSSEVELADFCRLLEHLLPDRVTPLPVTRAAGLPKRINFASQSGLAVMKALAELAVILFGKELEIEVSAVPPEPGGGNPPSLAFRMLATDGSQEAAEGEEVAAFALRRGITPNTVVDLLYVEKIVELQGGGFFFHRRQGRVYGFDIHLPYRALGE